MLKLGKVSALTKTIDFVSPYFDGQTVSGMPNRKPLP